MYERNKLNMDQYSSFKLETKKLPTVQTNFICVIVFQVNQSTDGSICTCLTSELFSKL